MFAVHVTRVLRPVGVLLGGSGRARILSAPPIAALMRPPPSALGQAHKAVENRADGDGSC